MESPGKRKIFSDLAQLRTDSCDIYRSYPTAANLIPAAKPLGLTSSKTLLYVLKYKQMTTRLHEKAGLRPPCLNPRIGW